jgi:hypothetical protein
LNGRSENVKDQERRMTDETTPHDSAAMPPASAGSHPFWAWWSHDLGIGYFADIKSRAIAYRDAGCGEIFPIYRQPQPTLTDEEREAIEWASTVEWGSNPHAATLRGLLERLT